VKEGKAVSEERSRKQVPARSARLSESSTTEFPYAVDIVVVRAAPEHGWSQYDRPRPPFDTPARS
jgi:hypothetical protein